MTLFPILSVILFYIIADPFEVIYKYSKHYNDPKIVYNRDYNSLDLLKNSLSVKEYDSFVFGSSRSLAFTCLDWTRDSNNHGCYHFDASGESLYGIYKKIEWLDENDVKIKNALIVLDAGLLASIKNSDTHLTIKHPEISKENRLYFQYVFIRAFFQQAFFVGYIDYKIRGKVSPQFSNFFEKSRFVFDGNSNDIYFESAENEIADGTYFKGKEKIFYTRTEDIKYSDPVIKNPQKQMLDNIASILNKNKSKYKIIISPLYDQIKLNPLDLSELNSIFGYDNVHNYSGINTYTSDIQNYYETSHYRRRVGKAILEEVYGRNNNPGSEAGHHNQK